MIPYPQIFLVLATLIVVSLAVHVFVRRVFLASISIGVLCGLVFTVMGLIQDHRLSFVPFFAGGLYGLAFGLFVGLFFYLGRKFTK
jgi:hypothetical protein